MNIKDLPNKITESVLDIAISDGDWISIITKEVNENNCTYYLFNKYKIYSQKIINKNKIKKKIFKFPRVSLLSVRQNGIYEEYLLFEKFLIYKREKEFWSDRG